MDEQQVIEIIWRQDRTHHYYHQCETANRQEGIVVNIGDSPISSSTGSPRNLGVLFDSTCCLNDDVNQIFQNINYKLYSIGKIRKYLDRRSTDINDEFCSDIPFRSLQQPFIWHHWIFDIFATTLPE